MKTNNIFADKVETQQVNMKITQEPLNLHAVKLDTDSTIETTEKNKNALEETYRINVKFPYKWKYGHIKELSDVEKAGFNQIKHRGRRQYQKPCALCGEEGVIKFIKISNGNHSFICESCAEQYVLSATRLTDQGM